MKKIVLSAVAVLAMSSFAVAGGDIEPAAPVAVPMAMEGNFYAGISYSCYDVKQTDGNRIGTTIDEDFESAMLQAGYKFNQYVSVEGRYWIGLEEDVLVDNTLYNDFTANSWGLYVKPMYPVYDGLDVYALLGYASTSYDDVVEDVDGFSWGLGIEYTFSNNIGLFIDYASLNYDSGTYNDDYVDTYNFGVNYKF
jgi:opacity protein-like surface antigen